MQSRYDEIQQLGAKVFGVSADTVEKNLELASRQEFDISLLSDADGKATNAFGLLHTGASIEGGDIARPAVFIIDGSGRIAWRYFPDDYRIRVRAEAVIAQLQAI